MRIFPLLFFYLYCPSLGRSNAQHLNNLNPLPWRPGIKGQLFENDIFAGRRPNSFISSHMILIILVTIQIQENVGMNAPSMWWPTKLHIFWLVSVWPWYVSFERLYPVSAPPVWPCRSWLKEEDSIHSRERDPKTYTILISDEVVVLKRTTVCTGETIDQIYLARWCIYETGRWLRSIGKFARYARRLTHAPCNMPLLERFWRDLLDLICLANDPIRWPLWSSRQWSFILQPKCWHLISVVLNVVLPDHGALSPKKLHGVQFSSSSLAPLFTSSSPLLQTPRCGETSQAINQS